MQTLQTLINILKSSWAFVILGLFPFIFLLTTRKILGQSTIDILTSWPFVISVSVIPIILLVFTRVIAGRFTEVSIGSSEIKSDIEDLRKTIQAGIGPSKAPDAIEEKRQKFLKIPNVSFHYADKERIKNFYNDYFREPTIENIVREIASETSGDIMGGLPKVLEARAGGKDLSKWISTIKLPDTSLNGMFHRYQRETIRNNQVTVGLELVDVQLSELEEFERLVGVIKSVFGLQIEENELLRRRAALKEKAAEKTLAKLEEAAGWVLVEGSFLILETGTDFYKLAYQHPVNEYIQGSEKTVMFTVLIPKASIEEHVAGNYMQALGKAIPIKVYGEVWRPVNRKSGDWDLQITPLAVY